MLTKNCNHTVLEAERKEKEITVNVKCTGATKGCDDATCLHRCKHEVVKDKSRWNDVVSSCRAWIICLESPDEKRVSCVSCD